jgi:hypothetical protein
LQNRSKQGIFKAMDRQQSELRGPLSRAFWEALASGTHASVRERVGPGTVHLPGGSAIGGDDVAPVLQTLSESLRSITTHFEHERTLQSAGRDASIGLLWVGGTGERTCLRTLVVCEKREGRQIDLRVYLPAHVPFALPSGTPVADPKKSSAAAGLSRELAWSLETRDFASFQKLFEHDAVAEASDGARAEALLSYFEALAGLEARVTSSMDADDFSVVELWSDAQAIRVALVGQRGGSGLFARIRRYGG